MTSGSGLNTSCPARVAIGVLPRGTTDGSLTPSSGSCAPAVHGAICPASSGIGSGRMYASPVGASTGYSSALHKPGVVTLPWRICASIRPACAPTNPLPAPRKSRYAGNRPRARRTEQQTSGGGRCLGESPAGDALGRADCRYRLCRQGYRAFAGTGCHRGQRLRRRSLRGYDRSRRCSREALKKPNFREVAGLQPA